MPSETLERRVWWKASVLFFLSGAAGLSYEIVWVRMLTSLWGSSSAAIAAAVGAFLAGLGVGAHLCGRRSLRFSRPLRAYAVLELAVALLALTVPVWIRGLRPLSSELHALADVHPVALAAARFGLTFLLLGPATVLMGATFPLLVHAFSSEKSWAGPAAAWLYFLNGVGASAGAVAAGFVLLPVWGSVTTNTATACCSAGVAAAAAWLARGEPRRSPPASAAAPAAEAAGPGGSRSEVWPLRISAALVGFAALVLQMTWTRQAVLVTGGSVYAFTAILAVFVFSIACGALLYRLVPALRTRRSWGLLLATAGVIVGVLIGQALRPGLTRTVAALSDLRAGAGYDAALFVFVALALSGVATFFGGLLFPMLVGFARHDSDSSGDAAGSVYAWNTLGAVVGVGLASPALFPLFGTHGLAVAGAALYVPAAFLASRSAERTAPPWILAAWLLVALVGGSALAPGVAGTKLLNSGAFLYGNAFLDGPGEDAELLFHRTGSAANVTVLSVDPGRGRAPNVSIRTNGKVDGSTDPSDMLTQVGAAYLPWILRPQDSPRVFVIGFGTGTTAGASLQLPGSQVVCCEIEPAMLAASPHFSWVNHSPESAARFRSVVDDGRNRLQSTDETFDLIVSMPSNPWIAGIGSLYTTEFYRAASSRLAEGGVLTQWIQVYQISAADYARILATATSVFEHASLLYLTDADTLLVLSGEPLLPSRETLARAAQGIGSSSAMAADLESYLGSTDPSSLLLRHLTLDRRGVEEFVREHWDGELNTDENARLEFDAPASVFGGGDGDGGEPGALQALYAGADPALPPLLAERWGWSEGALEALLEVRSRFAQRGERSFVLEMSRRVVEAITDASPVFPSPVFLYDAALAGRRAGTEEWTATIEQLLDREPSLAQQLGASLGQGGDAEGAAIVFGELASRFPRSPTTLARYGIALVQLGRVGEASDLADRARSLDATDETVRVLTDLLGGG